MVVSDLLRWSLPPKFVAVVLLLLWNTAVVTTQDLDFTELFSGAGAVTRGCWAEGLDGSAIDTDYDARCMDLCTDAGFALSVAQVLRCKPGGFVLIALVCSSFSVMSRHTSGRSFLTPEGKDHRFVIEGNLLSARVALIIHLCSARGLRWLLEQPSRSILNAMPWMQRLWGYVQAYRTTFWMGNFGHESPKQHVVWSNDEGMLELLRERAGYMSAAEQASRESQLVRSYIDCNGKRRCVGRKKELKNSQRYPDDFGTWLASVVKNRSCVSLPPPKDIVELDYGFSDAEIFLDKCTMVVTSGDGMPLLGICGDPCKEAKIDRIITYLMKSSRIDYPGNWFEIFAAIFPPMIRSRSGQPTG